MKNVRMLFALFLTFVMVLSACNPVKVEVAASALERVTNPQVSASEVGELVDGNTNFTFDLYQSLSDSEGNLFFSPYSISLALAMAYAGAGGETASQMESTLHLPFSDGSLPPVFNSLDLDLAQRPLQTSGVDAEDRFNLSIVNSMWGQKGWSFLPEFLDALALYYGSGMRLVDFMNAPEDARGLINNWVSDQTNRRISDLLPQGVIDQWTRLVLVNAIYFKAVWEYEFSANKTKDGPFTLLDGNRVSVPMMSFEHPVPLACAQGDGWQAVALPYKGNLVEMVILMPDVGGFDSFQSSFSAGIYNEIMAKLQIQDVDLTMPKYTFSSQFELGDTLAEMGMPDAFDSGLADFSAIDGQADLFIDHVVHEAFVAVDEKGTEAAAATAVIISPTAAMPAGIVMNVDHPFIFFIRDVPTGTLLFAGRVVDPE